MYRFELALIVTVAALWPFQLTAEDDPVLATVNGVKIHESAILSSFHQKLNTNQRTKLIRKVLPRVVTNEVIVQAAEAAGIPDDPNFQAQIAATQTQFARSLVVTTATAYLRSHIPASSQENTNLIKAEAAVYYAAHAEEFAEMEDRSALLSIRRRIAMKQRSDQFAKLIDEALAELNFNVAGTAVSADIVKASFINRARSAGEREDLWELIHQRAGAEEPDRGASGKEVQAYFDAIFAVKIEISKQELTVKDLYPVTVSDSPQVVPNARLSMLSLLQNYFVAAKAESDGFEAPARTGFDPERNLLIQTYLKKNTAENLQKIKIAVSTIDEYLAANPDRFAAKLERKNGKRAVRAAITTILRAHKTRELRDEFFKGLMSSAEVKYFDDRFTPIVPDQQN